MISEKNNYKFTVFTPTYNRADKLIRVYDSLKAQTFRDFEWLIVDDGSIDDTRTVVEAWQREASFPIRYYQQENQGKHVAFNKGVELAQGELFLNLDSDDACVPDALQQFLKVWESIPDNQRDQFTGATCLTMDEQGTIAGDKFPSDVFDSDSAECTFRYKVTGEKWGFHRTDILRRFPFPVIAGHKFIPETVVWFAIANSYKTRYVNQVLRIYYQDEGHAQGNRLTHARNYRNISPGLLMLNRQNIISGIRWFKFSPLLFIRAATNLSRFALHSEVSIKNGPEGLGWLGSLLWLLTIPFGYVLYWRDRMAAGN